MSRTCPACGSDKVCSVEEAKLVFAHFEDWGPAEMIENADKVCSFCHSARINGEWVRMQSVNQRARELDMASGSSTKTRADWRNRLREGESNI